MTTDNKNSKEEKSNENKEPEKKAEEKVEKSDIEIKIEELEQEKATMTDSYQRLAAEYDNYRKRTIREKDAIFTNATAGLVVAFLPVMDSMEMAMKNIRESDSNTAQLREGIENLYRKFSEVLDNLDVEIIECEGEDFDPEYHHAVEHIEDEKYGENKVAEELMKGYIYKDKVIRHSLVKVAN